MTRREPQLPGLNACGPPFNATKAA
jgi:hypothetical protein